MNPRRRAVRLGTVVAWALLTVIGTGAPARAAGVDSLDVQVEIAGEGFRGPLRTNIEATLSLAQTEGRKARRQLDPARVRQLHASATEEIERALEPFGYYRPQVTATLDREGEAWTARYEVDPGPQMTLSAVDVEVVGPGADETAFQSAVASFPLASGNGLDHSAYEEGKAGLARVAGSLGYLSATFDAARIEIDLARYTASIALRLATGPHYQFGPVTFEQDVLKPGLLRGYVTFEPGDPFDYEELLSLQDVLADSPYFQRVEVLAPPEEAIDSRVPVTVTLVPAAAQKWDLGVGYGTDTSARGTVDLDLRRINRRGHRGEGQFTLSGIEQSIAARYLIPGSYPRTDVLAFTLGFARLEPDSSVSETVLAGVGRTRSRGRWREAYGLTFQRAEFEVGVDEGISELLIPEASWSRVKTDDRIFPRHGGRVQLKVRGAAEDVVSDSTFLQATAQAKAIRSLSSRIRVIGRLDMGYTWTSDFRDLPPAIRFFAGGDQSVRGYAYQELGPLDTEGNVIGGEALLAGSLELESLFLDLGRFGRWGAAAFYDVGGAARDFAEDLEEGLGVGLRWLSPIGLVRADVAWATSEPGAPVSFHLMIGPDL